jgi:hypothetical protein
VKSSFALLLCGVVAAGGCASGGRYIEPRSELDRKIYYLEKDKENSGHPISSALYDGKSKRVERVPMPAVVDVNSAIQVFVATAELVGGATRGAASKESEALLKRKEAVLEALTSLSNLAQARQRTIAAYEKKDPAEFFRARGESDGIERSLLRRLTTLWSAQEDRETYARLQKAYDRPHFAQLQEFLGAEIVSIDAANRELATELRTRGRTLSLEAFLLSPGKQPAAIHMDGYDSIKQQDLRRHDPFGLDLSAPEREKLNEHIAANQNVAQTLEQLRNGEIALKGAVRGMIAEMSPEIGALAAEAERLHDRLKPSTLSARRDETRKLVNEALDALEKRNAALAANDKAALEGKRDKLLEEVSKDAGELAGALQDWIKQATGLRDNWAKATTPAAVSNLIASTVGLAKKFEGSRDKLSSLADRVQARAQEFVQSLAKEAAAEERELLGRAEIVELRDNLQDYVRDLQQGVALVTNVVLLLGRAQARDMAQMPSSPSLAFDVPVGELKDTFIDLEATPRQIGDSIVVKATLKDGMKAEETAEARFRVGRYGYYAELSPAVVLVKPDRLAGANDGFRFAPTLSWMHHWAPRPENSSRRASVFRGLDPAIGIHSAFLNFDSTIANDAVQIGIGATLSLWKDRLQFGLGYNLMARSDDEGRRYFFIGSDLIGLLQAIGIGKQ